MNEINMKDSKIEYQMMLLKKDLHNFKEFIEMKKNLMIDIIEIEVYQMSEEKIKRLVYMMVLSSLQEMNKLLLLEIEIYNYCFILSHLVELVDTADLKSALYNL